MPDSEFVFPAEYLKTRRSADHMNTPARLAVRPTRVQVPSGWCREYVQLARQGAEAKADRIMEQFEGAGLIAHRPMPDTDDAIAKETLREAVVIALHPAISIKDKLTAINTCLTYTKMRPVSKAEINVKRPEDWLTEAIEASKDAAT